MSWGATIEITPEEGVVITNLSNVESKEHKSQFEAAQAAVLAIVIGSPPAMGWPDYKFRATLSGHGNPDNKPVEGWTNDFVSINIYQISEEAE